MKRILLILALLALTACGRTFEQRTAKYAEVRPVVENRAAVLEAPKETKKGEEPAPQLWGFVDEAGKLVVEPRYAEVRDFADERAAVRLPESDLWGYIDLHGKWIAKPQFKVAEAFSQGQAWVQNDKGLRGLIDKSGDFIIPCRYTRIGNPDRNGWRRVQRSGKWGILDADGEEAVAAVYDKIGKPDGRLLPVAQANKWGLIDLTNGAVITECKYSAIGKHDKYDYLKVAIGNMQGLIDKKGAEVLPCQFAYISDFTGGYARVNAGGKDFHADSTATAPTVDTLGGQWGLLDSLGKQIIPCRYYALTWPSEGLMAYTKAQHGLWGYVDVAGRELIPTRYTVVRPFAQGIAVVSHDGKTFGIIDRTGSELSSFRYKILGDFSDGLAAFNTNPTGKYFEGMAPRCGYIDTQGREVIEPRWDDAQAFSELRAAVMRLGQNHDDFTEERWGYIDTSGYLVIPYKYNEAYPFHCGLARVFIKDKGYGYIDRKGAEIVPCQYDEASDFVDFTARVKQGERTFTIDDTGKIVK